MSVWNDILWHFWLSAGRNSDKYKNTGTSVGWGSAPLAAETKVKGWRHRGESSKHTGTVIMLVIASLEARVQTAKEGKTVEHLLGAEAATLNSGATSNLCIKYTKYYAATREMWG
ncbi:hypothetical protein Tb09.244.1650 [Trypanosoma brucei brucei TREU927]|uniref:Uncharacterized protein n=1 Tax=Trypanosoma brucei brucei (strain 927/4 GUTat10.1) TaxID=185431 RepID=Q38CQ5_TRYB2|nr:hypothetical protein Tb09.244.1650 [Trypanosoma brucei brucei TREU927]EAN77415.1 hypothetical protein Tb09.244.1650 [Trypanosoma brucei brucei TREU927]